ncbi:MAG TPA: complement resistance protein TraT [Longimicrobiales bacterium]|nr:complement resistance protein TraT [Longimicrobiales bacterium]
MGTPTVSRAMNIVGSHSARRFAGGAAALVLVGSALSGCGAARTALRYGELETLSELSESVFLELRSDAPATVYVAEGSTAGRDVSIRSTLERDLVAVGYRLVDDPGEATYLMQINHRSLAETELGDGDRLGDAVSGAFAAGVAAGLAADVLGAGSRGSEGVALGVGLIGFLVDSKVKHVAHTLTTDLLVTETMREAGKEPARRRHQITVVSGASKVNLGLDEAMPAIVRSLSTSLSGLLPARGANGKRAPLAAGSG